MQITNYAPNYVDIRWKKKLITEKDGFLNLLFSISFLQNSARARNSDFLGGDVISIEFVNRYSAV